MRMNRSEAFRCQAESDLSVFQLLVSQDGMATCHWLHYLQMTSEKIGRAVRLADEQSGADALSHAAIVKALRLLRNQRGAARTLGMDSRQFQQLVDRCLPIAYEIERLAPSFAAGPNPEYPWHDPMKPASWIAPSCHQFSIAATMRGPDGQRYLRLLRELIARLDEVFVN